MGKYSTLNDLYKRKLIKQNYANINYYQGQMFHKIEADNNENSGEVKHC